MRIEQLTFSRFLAAISIVVFHFGYDVFPFNFESIAFLFKQANVGVSYFFILSGFVMIIAYGKKKEVNKKSFYVNRFARIYPVYFLALALVFVAQMLSGVQFRFFEFIINLLVVQAWVPTYALAFNGPGWSIAVELFFYALFPFLFNTFLKKWSLKRLIVWAVGFWFVSQLVFNALYYSPFYKEIPSTSHDFIYYFPLMHLNEFIVGNVLGVYFIKYLKDVKRNFDWIVLGLIVAIVVLLKMDLPINYHNGALAILFIPLIAFMSMNNGVITKVSKWKLLVYLGEISYGIYILQKPVFMLVKYCMKYINVSDPLVVFYVATSILLLVSAVSYTYIETPMRNGIKQLFKRPRKRIDKSFNAQALRSKQLTNLLND